MKAKDLKLAPDEVFPFEGHRDFLEWSQLRSWMRLWLHYCNWYYRTALSPDVRLDEFFDTPIVSSHWDIKRLDESLVRFGLMWKLYDLCALKGLSWQLPILSADHLVQVTSPLFL